MNKAASKKQNRFYESYNFGYISQFPRFCLVLKCDKDFDHLLMMHFLQSKAKLLKDSFSLVIKIVLEIDQNQP